MMRGRQGAAWSAIVVAMGGLWVAGCTGDVVPDEDAGGDREIALALEGEAEPELSDEGVAAEQGETVAEEAPTPEPTPARQTPPPSPPPARQTPPPTPPPAAQPEVVEPPAPEPTAPPEIPMVDITASTGSELEVELLQELSTRTSRPGDRFTASVTRPLIDGGMVMVPVNSLVRGEVTAVQKSGGNGEEAIIKVTLIDVFFNGRAWPLSASVVEADPRTEGRYSTGDKAARVGAGAVAGAILGRIVGGNSKGTIIGAAVGAAAGTAITLATEDVDAVLPEGASLRLRLDGPLTIRIPNPGG